MCFLFFLQSVLFKAMDVILFLFFRPPPQPQPQPPPKEKKEKKKKGCHVCLESVVQNLPAFFFHFQLRKSVAKAIRLSKVSFLSSKIWV